MKRYTSIFLLIFLSAISKAQDVSMALQKKPHITTAGLQLAWQKVAEPVNVSFATSSYRFAKELPPSIQIQKTWNVAGWKGEKVHTQILCWTKHHVKKLSVAVSDLRSSQGNLIHKKNIATGFLQYVITDEFRNGCGHRKPTDFDSSYVADLINTDINNAQVEKNHTQPMWLSIKIPATAKAGTYSGWATVFADKPYKLKIELEVINQILPPPAQWSYRLDLWQHPAAIARVHNLALWSKQHFDAMKKYYTLLANAGQKIITASIVDEPWGHQTYDDYPSLVKWTKHKNGSWSFDYTLFDKYISFVMGCGIKSQINCYSMVPWKVAFKYFDESAGKEAVFTDAIGSSAYNAFWATMLADFTKHLKSKGWFNITTIAMDERPMAAMKSVIQLLKRIDKDWKVSLAGDYHGEIENDIFDYCIASKWQFPDSLLLKRKHQGKFSTWYTCCTEKYPNGFTFSPPDEHVWMGWYTTSKHMDGYLRWAYNSWPKDPLQDSRFTAWPAGDTYQVYPGPLSSVRFEKLIEGIQDYEKINALRKQYSKTNQTEKMDQLERALKQFEIDKLYTQSATDIVDKVKPLLNK